MESYAESKSVVWRHRKASFFSEPALMLFKTWSADAAFERKDRKRSNQKLTKISNIRLILKIPSSADISIYIWANGSPAFTAISDLFGPLISKHNTEHHYEHDILHACQGSHSKIIVFSKVIKMFFDSSPAPWPHNAPIRPINIYIPMCLYIQMEWPPQECLNQTIRNISLIL